MTEAELPPRWSTIIIAIGAGIVAASQVGKIPPTLATIGLELDAGMVALGWVASMFSLTGALTGVLLGIMGQRIDSRTLVVAALLILAIACVAGAYATSTTWLLVTRAFEGIGLIAVAVSVPRLVFANAGAERGFAMGLWSCYMPAGMSIGVVLGILMLQVSTWRTLWMLCGALCAIYALVFWIVTRNARVPEPLDTPLKFPGAAGRPGPWLLGGTFGTYALSWMALMVWLPQFLTGDAGIDATNAAWLTALVVAANLIGNFGGAALLRNGARRIRLIVIAQIVVGGCGMALMLFDQSTISTVILAFAFSAVGGLLPAAVFNASPLHARTPAEVAVVNGTIIQSTQTGQLIGAPLFGWLVSATGGWSALSGVFALMCVLGILSAIAANRVRLHRPAAEVAP